VRAHPRHHQLPQPSAPRRHAREPRVARRRPAQPQHAQREAGVGKGGEEGVPGVGLAEVELCQGGAAADEAREGPAVEGGRGQLLLADAQGLVGVVGVGGFCLGGEGGELVLKSGGSGLVVKGKTPRARADKKRLAATTKSGPTHPNPDNSELPHLQAAAVLRDRRADIRREAARHPIPICRAPLAAGRDVQQPQPRAAIDDEPLQPRGRDARARVQRQRAQGAAVAEGAQCGVGDAVAAQEGEGVEEGAGGGKGGEGGVCDEAAKRAVVGPALVLFRGWSG